MFATAVMSKTTREGGDFFPLTVDYEEKFYAAGRILGSRFMRREGRPSEEAILISRVIDRSCRPLFNHRIRNEVQIIVMTLAIDEENDPDVPAVIAASLALGTSDIPWGGPVGAVRAIQNGERVILNPSYEERKNAKFDTFYTGIAGHLNMIEAEAKETPEETLLSAFDEGMKEINQVVEFQKNIISEIGKEKTAFEFPEPTPELRAAFKEYETKLEDAIYGPDKQTRTDDTAAVKTDWMQYVAEAFPDMPRAVAEHLFEDATNDIVHKNILDASEGQEKRPDGRKVNELRPLFTNAHILDRHHGSALFFRGETHILSVATLGAPSDVLLIEGMEIREKRHFMHHYNFPPFSVGETRAMRGPGRREIGHGALAEKALRAVVPSKDTFPYTIRLVSETLSSNGSSSMGSVCASSIAMMDAGIPITSAVAGSSMGLMMYADHETGAVKKYKVLTDIQGVEDHLGDMDFKVAGTRNGVTAIQMDVKVDGVTLEIVKDAFASAASARMQILDAMDTAIREPRSELSPYAPRIVILTINPEKIRDIIGPGGKVINEIIALTDTQIDIEQDGHVFITGMKQENVAKAQELIEEITREYEPGQRFTGKVTRIFNFGAMVEFAPQQEGLVHISELAPFRVETVTDVVDVGDVVPVEIISIDEMGRINLSIKLVAALEPKKKSQPAQHHRASHERTGGPHHDRRH
ncbi:MAG: polyribonucleotide nucleotidyltransferase [Parcubacteria group bacterium Gr01-1014_29]|nr:MAG: polyribonucleotide nucleotidyltransferase [Parcubacteria group bacterium Gr01-1014_29]